MNQMSELPVNKWNLLFHNKDLEARYQRSQMVPQLLYHKIMMVCATIACFICLIIFIAQSQPLSLSLQMGLALVVVFCQLMLGKFLLPYFHVVYALNYVSCILFGQYISYTETNISQYTLGHSYCILMICCLRLSHNKIKGLFVVATPIAILLSQDAFKLENLYLILYAVQGTLCLAFVIYHVEYQSRQAFFNSITAALHIELLQEFSTDGLFALSFNDRQQQFILEFHNNKMINYCDITDESQRKNFLRKSYIIDSEIKQNIHESLEDYLFQKNKKDVEFLFENKQIILEENNKTHIIQITLKMIHLHKKIIFISLQNNQLNDLIDQKQQINNNYSNIIINQSLQIARLQERFMDELNQMNINNKQKQQYLHLRCINLQIRNILNNYLVFFQQDKILKIIQDTKSWRFCKFMQSLQHFFINQAFQSRRKFELINQLPNCFSSKINYNILSQILINLFESALNDSLIDTTILLTIKMNNNLNPLYKRRKANHDVLTLPEDSTQYNNISNNQFLIIFQFTYESCDQIVENDQQQGLEIITNEKVRDFQISNSQNWALQECNNLFQFEYIQSKKTLNYQGTLCVVKDFFIYADQTQLDISFINTSPLKNQI